MVCTKTGNIRRQNLNEEGKTLARGEECRIPMQRKNRLEKSIALAIQYPYLKDTLHSTYSIIIVIVIY